jgi:uncharacterized membrane protein
MTPPPAAGPQPAAEGLTPTPHRTPAAAISAVAAVDLMVVGDVPGAVRTVFALPVLLLLPGWLTLRALRWDLPPGWDGLLRSLAISLLWLLGISFVLAVLPTGGGLSTQGCLIGFNLVMLGLIAAESRARAATAVRTAPRRTATALEPRRAAARARVAAGLPASAGRAGGWSTGVRSLVATALRTLPRRAVAALGAASAAVGLAAAGALQLTAGAGPGLTESAFAAGAAAVVLAASALADGERREPPRAAEQAAATTVYLVGLAVLLATSLRGVGATGHDIKTELAVFDDVLSRGSWWPGGPYPAYNSCLSITVLPTFLCRLLDIPPPDVFRICYQVIFAVVPVGVLLIARRLLPPRPALLAGVLFIAFPTFVNDLPMLNRQEIALVFFAVGVLTLVDVRGSARRRVAMFVALAVGLTVSHYSTAYFAAATVLIGWPLSLLSSSGRATARRAPAGRHRELGERRPANAATDVSAPGALSWPAALALIVLPVAWGAFTGNTADLLRTAEATVASLGSKVGATSDSVSYSFFDGAPQPTDRQALNAYLTDVEAHRTGVFAPPGCMPHLLAPDMLPATRIGRSLSSLGLAPGTANAWARSAAVVVFQAGALVGVGLSWWRSRGSAGVDAVLAVLGVASLVVLAAVVVLPQLSVSYGLLRLYQQALVVLAPAVVGALAATADRLGRLAPGRGARHTRLLPAAAVVGCLVTTSGLVPQLTGGYPPQLNLNNAGDYYRAYYVSTDDLDAAKWAERHVPADATVSADAADAATLRSATKLYTMEGIGPGLVPPYAYILVKRRGTAQIQAVAVFRERILTYALPSSCVSRGRRLLYSDGQHLVYGPAA